jgi:hypothetical protein
VRERLEKTVNSLNTPAESRCRGDRAWVVVVVVVVVGVRGGL